MKNIVLLKRLEHLRDLKLPFYATSGSAGMDLAAAISEKIIIKAGEFKMIPTGICLCLPDGYEAQVRPRSGLAAKYGVTVLNSPGTIDSDYRGEVKVLLINCGSSDFVVEHGMRIAQMVFAKYEQILIEEVESLESTIRGEDGFGSTGL